MFVSLFLSLGVLAIARPDVRAILTRPTDGFEVDTFVLDNHIVHVATGFVSYDSTQRQFVTSTTANTVYVYFTTGLDTLRVLTIPAVDKVLCTPKQVLHNFIITSCLSEFEVELTIIDQPGLPWADPVGTAVHIRVQSPGMVGIVVMESVPIAAGIIPNSNPLDEFHGFDQRQYVQVSAGASVWPMELCDQPEDVTPSQLVYVIRSMSALIVNGSVSFDLTESACITSPWKIPAGKSSIKVVSVPGAGYVFVGTVQSANPVPVPAYYTQRNKPIVQFTEDGNGGIIALQVGPTLGFTAKSNIHATGVASGDVFVRQARRITDGHVAVSFEALFRSASDTTIAFNSLGIRALSTSQLSRQTLAVVFGVPLNDFLPVSAAAFFGGRPRPSASLSYTSVVPVQTKDRIGWSGICDGQGWANVAHGADIVSAPCVIYTATDLAVTSFTTFTRPLAVASAGQMDTFPGVIYHGVLENGAVVGTAYSIEEHNPTTVDFTRPDGSFGPIEVGVRQEAIFVAIDLALDNETVPSPPMSPGVPSIVPRAPALPSAVEPVAPVAPVEPVSPRAPMVPHHVPVPVAPSGGSGFAFAVFVFILIAVVIVAAVYLYRTRFAGRQYDEEESLYRIV